MRKIKFAFLGAILALFGTLISCTQEEKYTPEDKDFSVIDDYFVNFKEAESIANNLLLVNTKENLTDKSIHKDGVKNKKEVSFIKEVPDKNKNTAFYIINYEGGGFVILAADKRSEPILAFSDEHNFNMDSEYFPTGLVGWLYNSKENIEKYRDGQLDFEPEAAMKWKDLKNGGADVITYRKVEPEEPDCTPYVIQKGPFLETTWGQGCGYNSLTPSMTCGHCNNAYTGCVATAMAQIMKYHQFPSSYNWSNMPNSYGTTSTAGLMRDLGIAVNMNYTCDGSRASTKNEVASSFKNDFGYSSATYSDYNYQTVKNELNNNRPVVLRGGRDSGWWIFGQYSDGHAWVSDGFLSYIDPCWGSTLKFNMNWGWDGTYNGWYSFNNFNPGDHTFNYKTGMVYNIKP